MRDSYKNKIYGVWILDKKVNNRYLYDTSGFDGYQYPIIYDFSSSGDVFVRYCGYNDTTLKWSLKSDSIFTLDTLDYNIFKLDKDNLTLIDYNSADTFWLTFKRPEKVPLNYSKQEMENILLSGIWSIADTIYYKGLSYFEFFDNHTMVFRAQIFDRILEDTTDNLQLELWGIAEHKNYFFLYNYRDRMGNGNYYKMSQIIDITPSLYIIADSYSATGEINFINNRHYYSVPHSEKTIQGIWLSKNSLDKKYRSNLPYKFIENGKVALFNGSLKLTIDSEHLILQLDTLSPVDYEWKLGKDSRTLVLKRYYEDPEYKGYYFDCINVLELSENKLKVRLFNDIYFTAGQEYPYQYLLNLVQDFKRVK